jgi:hypothetical protein
MLNTNGIFMNERPLIILGMHRSGTSLVAGWIHKMGIDMGTYFPKSDYANKTGYYEDLDFYNIHEEIFKLNSIPHGGFISKDIVIDEHYKKKLEYLISFKKEKNKQWGWKDPRTCLFTDVYEELIPNANYLVLYRDFEEVISSLLRRDIKNLYHKLLNTGMINKLRYFLFKRAKTSEIYSKNTGTYIKTWVFYNKKLLDLINNNTVKCMVLEYTDIIKNEKRVTDYLKAAGYDLKDIPFKEVFFERLIHKEKSALNISENLEESAKETLNLLRKRNSLTNNL